MTYGNSVKNGKIRRRRKYFLVILPLFIVSCILLSGCSLDKGSYQQQPSQQQKQQVQQTNQQILQAQNQQSQQQNQQTQQSLLSLDYADNSSNSYGTLNVTFNGTPKTYSAVGEVDTRTGSNYTLFFCINNDVNRDAIIIQLPSSVKSGDVFTAESADMRAGLSSFSFTYIDKTGTMNLLGDPTNPNVFEGFALIIDKWDGRGGEVTGRLQSVIRPMYSDTVVLQNGSFKAKIRR